jgi:GT2 family glycosyltransferase
MSAGMNILFNGTGYDIGFLDFNGPAYDTSGPRGALCGAAIMVRKEEFLSLDGFDVRYFLYAEDLDLCWRYWLSGLSVQYVAQSVIYHAFGGTSGSDRHTPLRVFYRIRNGFMNILKSYELLHIPFPLAFNGIFHASQFVFFLGTCRWKSAWAVLRAYGDCLRNLPYVLTVRKKVQSQRVLRDRDLVERKLLLPLSAGFRELLRLRRAARTRIQ